jgi:hypothetical protein
VALLLALTGLASAAVAAVAYADPVIRRVERELPDAPCEVQVPAAPQVSAVGP